MVDKKAPEIKKVKKRWISIVAPREFSGSVIGETLCVDINECIGKVLSINFMQLTGDIKKQNVNIKLKINKIAENQAITEAIGYELAPSHIKRLVRRAKAKLEDSFLVETKDNIKLRIKPLVFAQNETKKSIMTSLRKNIRIFFIDNIKKLSFAEVFPAIISNKLQKELKHSLKKVYPVSISEVRVLERV